MSKPKPTKKVSNHQQLMAVLKESNVVKEREPPVAMKRQSDAMAVCKKMDSFLSLEPSERMAVMKSFVDDHTGGIANMFLLMDIDERNEYIGSVISSL